MHTEGITNYTHRVYGREKSKGRFKPMDLRNGRFVTNLIYASMLSEDQALTVVQELNDLNPTFEFEVRKI